MNPEMEKPHSNLAKWAKIITIAGVILGLLGSFSGWIIAHVSAYKESVTLKMEEHRDRIRFLEAQAFGAERAARMSVARKARLRRATKP